MFGLYLKKFVKFVQKTQIFGNSPTFLPIHRLQNDQMFQYHYNIEDTIKLVVK